MSSFSALHKAAVLGAALGFVMSFSPSCGRMPTTVKECDSSTCAGCCDASGNCHTGLNKDVCGSGGATCGACATGQSCTESAPDAGGRCVSTGGDGGTGGGTGGGTATGGGSATGGGAGGGGGAVCNASNCADGCCKNGVCLKSQNVTSCGKGGGACSICSMGNTCVNAACTPCAGCIDIQTGQCKPGNTDVQCGAAGTFCKACDTAAGQMCNSGACTGGSVCNATTCPDGCCDGNTCKARSAFTAAQCGTGTPGAACVTCQGSCDLDAGACVNGPSGGGLGGFGGGFFPPLGGGSGSLDLCGGCPTSECCDVIECVPAGDSCFLSSIVGGASVSCDGPSQACK